MRSIRIYYISSFIKNSTRHFQSAFFLLVFGLLPIAGCSSNRASSVPSDFSFVLDARIADKETAQHVNIRINAKGKAEYDIYESGGVIQYDLNDIVIYGTDQVVSSANFKLSKAELGRLWDAINQSRFFELETKYQMAIGGSYAFAMVEADGRKHIVDNIGVEVPEIRVLIETVSALMPEGVDLEYGKGYIFEK